jgi:FkbM family methyltransferase
MRKDFSQIEYLLGLLRQMRDLLDQTKNAAVIGQGLKEGVEAVNLQIYGREQLPLLPVEVETQDAGLLLEQLEQWLAYQETELRIRKDISVKIDYDFHVFMEHVKYSTREVLVEESKQCLQKLREYNEDIYQGLIHSYNTFTEFWGSIDLDGGNVQLIENRVSQLKEHWDDFKWLYRELGDYRSKKVLYGILRCWITFEFEEKNKIKENNFSDYYDFDLISCSEEEVFVDLGAFNGDSARSFIDSFGNYKRIYCYEITPATAEKLRENLSGYENIICRNVGVGRQAGVMYLAQPDMVDSANRLNKQDGFEVEVVTLDEDIKEPVSFIKMDIEGSEMDAIEGARRHIVEEHPKLAVCTYHNNHHIWEVPRRLKELNPDYKLYMRYNGAWNGFQISEFVTFAL